MTKYADEAMGFDKVNIVEKIRILVTYSDTSSVEAENGVGTFGFFTITRSQQFISVLVSMSLQLSI